MTPAPKPCTMRPKIIISSVGEKVLMKLPITNMIMQAWNIIGCPKRAISQVLASRLATVVARNALVRNWALSCPTPKVPITFGIATLTIELAKTMTKNASNAAVVTSQRYIGP